MTAKRSPLDRTLTDLSPHPPCCLRCHLKRKIDVTAFPVKTMVRTETVLHSNFDVSLTFHNFSAEMLKEFAQKIVRPYFHGNMNEAIRCLMEKAITEEEFLQEVIEKNR